MITINWVFVKGGICLYGDSKSPKIVKDLLWSETPITWGNALKDNSKNPTHFPITGLSFFEARELAKDFGGRLPTSTEWEWMAAGEDERLYPWGNDPWDIEKANLQPSNIKSAIAVKSFPKGATPAGIFDVAGNVWEFTTSRMHKSGIIIRGGSYNSKVLHARSKFWNATVPEFKSYGVGLRIVRDY